MSTLTWPIWNYGIAVLRILQQCISTSSKFTYKLGVNDCKSNALALALPSRVSTVCWNSSCDGIATIHCWFVGSRIIRTRQSPSVSGAVYMQCWRFLTRRKQPCDVFTVSYCSAERWYHMSNFMKPQNFLILINPTFVNISNTHPKHVTWSFSCPRR